MADVKMIIVEHLIYMHKEVLGVMRNDEKDNHYYSHKQFELLTHSLKEIALSFPPKDDPVAV
tara:strand:- start:1128 stop:1313 length:186 start_codon:yes stop_codon:yes gene_type:complete